MEQIGKKHPDADAQMINISLKIEKFQQEGFVILSVDCKKKDPLGNYANNGSDICKEPINVKDHDFKESDTIVVAPYGVFDIILNNGFINLGKSKDTPEFAVNSIKKWWYDAGIRYYRNINGLFITCDGGGSNSYRSHRFKMLLQDLANEIGLKIVISHYPPGKSKYNKIEHQLFNHISNNWRANPLCDIPTILMFIVNTTTSKGLKVFASVDMHEYKTGIKVDKKDLRKLLLVFDDFLGQWNYSIYPESQRKSVQGIVDKQWKKIDAEEKAIKDKKKKSLKNKK